MTASGETEREGEGDTGVPPFRSTETVREREGD
jgi:hypothetical protein